MHPYSRLFLTYFTVLQILDFLTTVSFLQMGVEERNYLIRFLMGWGGSVKGLVVAKIAALAFAICAVRRKKYGLMFGVTGFYFDLVCWNLLSILLQAFNSWVGQW